jgi:hypothetical protein
MRVDTGSPFVGYVLEEDEILPSLILSELQLAGMKNLLAGAVSDLLSIPLDLDDGSAEGRNKRAYTQGQIAAYKFIIDQHHAALDESIRLTNLQTGNNQQG